MSAAHRQLGRAICQDPGQQAEAEPFAQDSHDPSTFDRGLALFQLMIKLKSAHDSLEPQRSLDGLVVGTRLAKPALRVVSHPHHAQFVFYSVPDDVAASFDWASQMMLADPANVRRAHSFPGFVS